jgi:HEAT repeat protein
MGSLILLEGELPLEKLLDRLLVLNFLMPHELGHVADWKDLLPIEVFRPEKPKLKFFDSKAVNHQAKEVVVDRIGIILGTLFGVFSPAESFRERIREVAASDYHAAEIMFDDHITRDAHEKPLMLRIAATCLSFSENPDISAARRRQMEDIAGEILEHLLETSNPKHREEIEAIYRYYCLVYKNIEMDFASFLIEHERWGEVAELGESAAPQLAELLLEKDDETRKEIIGVLWKIECSSAIPILVEALKNEDAWIRKNAIEALTVIGDTSVIPSLKQAALSDSNWKVRIHTIVALRWGNISVPSFTDLLETVFANDKVTYVKGVAANMLIERKNPDKNSDEFKTLYAYQLLTSEGEIKWDEVVRLGEFAIPALKDCLEDPEADVKRERVVETLGNIGHHSAIPILESMLNTSETIGFTESIIAALEKIAHPSGAPVLERALNMVKIWEASNLVAAGELDMVLQLGKQTIPALEKALNKLLNKLSDPEESSFDDHERADFIVEALGRIADPSAIPILEKALTNKITRQGAVQALGKIRHPSATRAIEKALKNKANSVREIAVKLLGRIGDESSIPHLEATLHNDELFWMRGKAAKTLIKLKKLRKGAEYDKLYAYQMAGKGKWNEVIKIGKPAIPVLSLVLELSKYSVVRRREAVKALGKISDPSVIPILKRAFSDDEAPGVRILAAETLVSIGEKDIGFELVQNLSGESREVRRSAAELLGIIGGPSDIPALEIALNDKSWHVRKGASEAIEKIKARSEE